MRPTRSVPPTRTVASLLALLALLAGACGPAAEESPPAGDPAETRPEDDEVAEDDIDDGLDDEIRLAIEDASADRGVAEAEIEVVRAEEVQWPDGAMGCPEEGEMYTQAIVPGYLIVLQAGDEELYYHGAEGEPPFHCQDPQAPTA